jgi:hypothetical protein
MIVVKYFDTGTGRWADVTGDIGQGLVIEPSGWGVAEPSAVVSWGDINGTLSSQTDLQNALNAKLSVVTNADVSGFINANKIGTGIIDNTEFNYLNGVSGDIQTQLNSKQNTLTNPVTGTGTNNEIAYFNSSGSSIASLPVATYPSLTELSYVKGVTSALQTQIDSKLQKELGPYEMWANNTGSIAESVGEPFQYTDELTYSGTITWTGTTAPSGTTTHTYQWQRVGSLVVLRINLHYATAGGTLTAVTMSLPTDCPAPRTPNGFSGNLSVLFNGSAHMSNALTISANVHRGHLRTNSNNTGYELHIVTSTSGAYRYAEITMNYFIE